MVDDFLKKEYFIIIYHFYKKPNKLNQNIKLSNFSKPYLRKNLLQNINIFFIPLTLLKKLLLMIRHLLNICMYFHKLNI